MAGTIERSRKAKDLELLFQIISGPILISSVWAPFVFVSEYVKNPPRRQEYEEALAI